MAWQIEETPAFRKWILSLRDEVGRAIILQRISRLAAEQIGDVKPVGEGVSELRINHGPGYRVYFVKRGSTVVVLLCGGDKSSQARDIIRAKSFAKDF
ncbi:type II toxin-antitoxin system RelE/ParE family toxin [Brevundimonas sp.]|uniref:type II toxin-antitoxin system RelE/ParE family toxin n=1 Tax=Brevundimonas sp. TaxID=1871086 RepID=UPI003D139680